MECIHVPGSVLLDAAASLPEGRNGKPPSEWPCKDCGTVKSPWLCLACGEIHCGRYVKAHALDHQKRQSDHCVCMDCVSYAVFCYKCDEFVINDTEHFYIDLARNHLQKLESWRVASGSQISASGAGHFVNDRENVDGTGNQDQENVSGRRDLRRRRSSESCDSNNKKKKFKTEEDCKASKSRASGLRNLGNTCFMNAVLQSLSNIQHFCCYMKQLPSLEDRIPATSAKKKIVTRKSRETEEDILLVEELRKTLIALWQGSKTAISPESLFSVIWKVVPRFRGYQQQDAHEFMRYLLDRLHSELLRLLPYPNNNSPFIGPKGKLTIVTAIFGGILQSEVKCLVCGMESKKHDPFLDLSLDIPQHFTAKSHKPKENETLAHLSDCLASFTDIEELEDSELYMCTNCKRRQRSTKKFWIRRLPNVLCLHLKRFRWNVYYRMKVETFVEFPIRGLDMSGFTLDNLHETRGNGGPGSDVYDLAAVIVHHGSGAGSGHYTAYAIHDNVWYHFNDSSVTVCDEQTVKKCKAYILFYIRRQLTLPEHLRL